MNPDLERIGQLGDIDAELVKIDRAVTKAEQKLATDTEALETRTTELADQRAALEANRTQEREVQRRLEKLRRRKSSANRVLEGGGGDAEAAQRQLEQCDLLLDEVETDLLEVLEAQDALEEAVAAAQAAVEKAKLVKNKKTN